MSTSTKHTYIAQRVHQEYTMRMLPLLFYEVSAWGMYPIIVYADSRAERSHEFTFHRLFNHIFLILCPYYWVDGI